MQERFDDIRAGGFAEGAGDVDFEPDGFEADLGAVGGFAGEREDIAPTDRLGGPPERFGHGLPHGDDDGAEYEIARRADKRLALGHRFGVDQLDEQIRSGTSDVGAKPAGEDVIFAFARTHGEGLDDDGLAGGGGGLGVVETRGDVVDPGLFFGAVDEEDLELVGDRWSGRVRRCARGFGLRGSVVGLVTAEKQSWTDNQEAREPCSK